MLFADKLLAMRLARGWTQKQLADASGLRQQTVAKWELGERIPSFEAVLALCNALGVEVGEFKGCEFGKRGRGNGRPPKADDTESAKPTTKPKGKRGKK